MKKQVIKDVIENVGQTFVDDPVYQIGPVYCAKVPVEGKWVRYFKRTPLVWMKPGPNGKLVPR